jgi:hypothetical protein
MSSRFGIDPEATFEYLYKKITEVYHEDRPHGTTLRSLQQLLTKHKNDLMNPLVYRVK